MQLDRSSHASEEFLERYAMGTLTEPALAGLEEHLLVCPHCQEQLKEIDGYIAAMRSAAGGLEQEDESRKRFWTRVSGALTFRRVAWALALAALALLGVALRLTTISSPPAFALVLETSRGAEVPHAPAGRSLEVRLDITGLPALPEYQVEVVNAGGRIESEAHASGAQGGVKAWLPKGLRSGNHFIRLYSPSRELLREYGMQVD
jgi:hypothetical protein